MSNLPGPPDPGSSPGANPARGAAWKLFDDAANFSDQANKIVSFVGAVVTPVLAVLWFLYGWLEDEVARWPRPWLLGGIIAFLAIGLLLWVVTFRKRARYNRWTLLLMASGGSLLIGLAGLVLFLMPPTPAWERLDVRKILGEHDKPQDLPLTLTRDQLTGKGQLFPGGETYRQLLSAKYDGRLTESWGAYYAPLFAPSTMPTSVSLKSGGKLNPQNASLGVLVVVWNESSGDIIKVARPQEYGYRSLGSSVSIPIVLNRDERAAMIIFVYPWTVEASNNLPDHFEEVVVVD
jgi:hypothetical protein